MQEIRHIAVFMAVAAVIAMVSCVKDPVTVPVAPDETFKGEMVLLAAGTTVNSVSTRAGESNGGISITPGTTYYMPDSYRFVCRMYYKASTAGNEFDVTGGSDITTWLKVEGNKGNSLYWRNSFLALDKNNPGLFDSFGNDAEATCLYWQNRKEHAFLAWTDLNKARTNTYLPDRNSGSLKFVPEDVMYEKNTGVQAQQWVDNGFEVFTGGVNLEFNTWEELRTYMESGTNYQDNIKGKVPEGITEADFEGQKYYYQFGWSCKYSEAVAEETNTDELHRKYGWIRYHMFYDKMTYDGPVSGDDIELRTDDQGNPTFLYDKAVNKYLAEIVYDKDDPSDQSLWKYNLTDEYGNARYNEENPRYTFYYKLLQQKQLRDVVTLLPANVSDLTRGGRSTISEQPDICQALTRQAPLGATQSANRVNLYFKHQFSLVQVNIKCSADLSVVISKDDITKVELLGVTEKGYVFTEIDKDGNVEPAAYEPVDITKYSDAHLSENEFGTSFEMFDMAQGNADYEYPAGYIKSYNALTFGQLQAIRITWKEPDSGIVHKSTYTVKDDQLRNLHSGYKYIWNIELRRGTLAIVRTEIVDWIVPEGELEYKTDGTIEKN